MTVIIHRRPLVSICVPAYRSQDFIQDTIEAALGQTVRDIEIIVSNDSAHPTPALDQFIGHGSITIHQQPQRLGWVDNSSFVLSQATGSFFMILPHDDRLEPGYVEACLDMLEREPACFAAYSDIVMLGNTAVASEVRGTITERVSLVMQDLYNGYSYRALMRRRPADWERLKLMHNPPTDFCADTTFILQQACIGELRRVPAALYTKNFGTENTHAQWPGIPAPVLREAWAEHCRQMGRIAAAAIGEGDFVADLVNHRLDARRVQEAPPYLKQAMDVTRDGTTHS